MTRRRTLTADLRKCDRSAYGHAWFEVEDPGRWTTERKFLLRDVAKCERCGAYRFRGLNAYGENESTWYDYPDGWDERWGTGNDRPAGNEIRVRILIEPKKLAPALKKVS